MTLLLLMLALADPGRAPERGCERRAGTAQCIEVERRHETLYRCKASCYIQDNKDGGYTPHLIKAERPTSQACIAELDRQAANRCRP